jgi:phage baseplate assembly protein W
VEVPVAGWGSGYWGTGPWGSGASSIAIDYAVAVATNRVRVFLTAPPRAVTPYGVGDALNATTWAVSRLDTGQVYNTASGVLVGPLVVDVSTAETFGPFDVLHRVSAPALRSAAGLLISAPTSADFYGLSAPIVATPPKTGVVDFAKALVPFNPAGGTLLIRASGDYKMQSGAELVRKLIVNRLMTTPGDFFHLPNYGIGFRVKEPLPTTDVQKLRAEVERQVRLEPEVEAAAVSIVMRPATNELAVQVLARLRNTGEEVQATVTASPLVSL